MGRWRRLLRDLDRGRCSTIWKRHQPLWKLFQRPWKYARIAGWFRHHFTRSIFRRALRFTHPGCDEWSVSGTRWLPHYSKSIGGKYRPRDVAKTSSWALQWHAWQFSNHPQRRHKDICNFERGSLGNPILDSNNRALIIYKRMPDEPTN